MANPLGVNGAPAQGREIQPGERRTYNVREWNDGKGGGDIIDTVTVCRTTRPYVHDLCDAYNARTGGNRWRVDPAGQLRID